MMRSEAETLAQTVIPDDSSNEEKEIQLLRRENEKLKMKNASLREIVQQLKKQPSHSESQEHFMKTLSVGKKTDSSKDAVSDPKEGRLSDLPEREDFTKGMLVKALYIGDNNWYEAKIQTKMKDRKYKIRYLLDGVVETVPEKLLKHMKLKMLKGKKW